jgi:phosphoenolpyruvate carboxykinase (ATP)
MATCVESNRQEITATEVINNASPARLYELGVAHEGAAITASGALATFSGEKTGRSPKDKRIVENPESAGDVWWGSVNIPASSESFIKCKEQALKFINGRDRVYIVDGFAGWDHEYRIKVRVICTLAYHALFMRDMMIRPSQEELKHFGEPDFVIYNAGEMTADRRIPGVSSNTNIMLDLERKELVILGTKYAGEMKKGIFTAMNYWMPKQGVLSMHCSANEGPRGEVTLFFGLSGTGKTTLSSDLRRKLIGDDEHCWTDHGIFNIEGGCYAKCINLTEELEPQVYRALRFGSVLENVVFDPETREPDYEDGSITENTRGCYPIELIDNAQIPCMGSHPKDIIFLTCDAFGVLPPVSRLTSAQAMYHFLSGYTAKTAGTEVGVNEPEATFSACFGAAFLVLHPARYAELLAKRMRQDHTRAWLVNTGWSGGSYGVGSRMKLTYTRAVIDAIHDGFLADVPLHEDPIFELQIPASCPGVPTEMLVPRNTWADKEAYDRTARKLAALFRENFAKYASGASDEVRQAGPKL